MSLPKLPKLPETSEEIDAFWKKMDENDATDVKLELYFSKEELDKMCDLEKLRVSNLKRNYDMMRELGKSFILNDISFFTVILQAFNCRMWYLKKKCI